MANYVNTSIEIRGLNAENVTWLNEKFKFYLDDYQDNMVHKLFDNVEVNEDGSVNHTEYYNLVGSKWCDIEDVDIDQTFTYLRFTSAWSKPEALVGWIVKNLTEKQKEVKVFVAWEDEMPNFFGAEMYIDGECVKGIEYSDDDEDVLLDEYLCDYSSNFAEVYEKWERSYEKDNEFEEKLGEIRSEIIWPFVFEKQQEFFNEYY